MQAFRLVNGGYVDRLIVFETLPERLVKGVRTREVVGLARSWAQWLIDIGSVRDVMRTTTTQNPDRSYRYTYTPIGKEPCFHILEYTDINADKERWREICEYLRLHVGPEVRLREKVEDMAIPMAPDAHSGVDIEPEDVPVIPIPEEITQQAQPKELIKQGEQIVVQEPAPKRRGRPRKVAVGA